MIEPEDLPGCAGLEKIKIGEDSSERLDVIPVKFRVIVTRRPKYAYRGHDGVIQAPAHLIEAGLPTEALLAQVAVAKYADGLPLYRQEGIYARDGVELDRSLLAQWMASLASSPPRLPITCSPASSRASGSSPTRRRSPPWRRAPAR